MRARLTPEDFAKGELVEPGWYPCEITEYKEEPANTDRSTNGLVTFKVLAAKDPKKVGANGRKLYNEKALGFAGGLLKALGAPADKDGNVDVDLSEATLVGRLVDVSFRRGESNKGNAFNEPVEFAPIGTVTKFNVEEYKKKKGAVPVAG